MTWSCVGYIDSETYDVSNMSRTRQTVAVEQRKREKVYEIRFPGS